MASEVLRLIESSARNPDPKKIFAPRRLIVCGLKTVMATEKTTVDLVLMSRAASAEFEKRFPKRPLASAAFEFARDNALAFIGGTETSRPHIKTHYFPGTNFQLGHVLTEKQVFDLGYVDPHMDTVCAQIARVAEYLIRHGKSSELAGTLREAGLIDQKHFVTVQRDLAETWEHTLDVLDRESDHADVPKLVCKSHPVQLFLFGLRGDMLSIGGACHVPGTDVANEFWTSAPPLEG